MLTDHLNPRHLLKHFMQLTVSALSFAIGLLSPLFERPPLLPALCGQQPRYNYSFDGFQGLTPDWWKKLLSH
jgi:hypothetical protein